jgi:LmbE family N-acetylglucosaminyl deacetylase
MTTMEAPAELLSHAPEERVGASRVLVIVAPHPDDEVIGFGGVMFDHIAAGGQLVIVSVTDGDAYDPAATAAERRSAGARRRDEQRESLGVLGIDAGVVVRLGIPDGSVASHVVSVTDALRGVLRSCESTGMPLVVTPWRADGHPDHMATTSAVRRAVASEILEVPIWSWRGRHVTEPGWRALSVVPISDAARDAKRAALARHRSQLTALPGGRPPILSPEFLADFDREVEVVVR